jgi:hypothetical protein
MLLCTAAKGAPVPASLWTVWVAAPVAGCQLRVTEPNKGIAVREGRPRHRDLLGRARTAASAVAVGRDQVAIVDIGVDQPAFGDAVVDQAHSMRAAGVPLMPVAMVVQVPLLVVARARE